MPLAVMVGGDLLGAALFQRWRVANDSRSPPCHFNVVGQCRALAAFALASVGSPLCSRSTAM
ncbi:MAG: hypothetical protein EP343_21645 [Deltaproteobacteria bacterium]|nr:MAG: hypothetical protein EP343_21645 [Deltaproteobacteria bacterium]